MITLPEAVSRAANRSVEAVAAVVVGPSLGGAGHQGKDRRGAVEGLDAGLFVHAQHHRRVRGVQIQACHVADLLDEQRVRRHLVLPDEVGLEPERAPYLAHRGLGHPRCFGHRPRRPVRRVRRDRLQRSITIAVADYWQKDVVASISGEAVVGVATDLTVISDKFLRLVLLRR